MAEKPSFMVALMGAAKKKAAKGPVVDDEPSEEEDGESDTGKVAAAGAVRRAISKGDDKALASALSDFFEYC